MLALCSMQSLSCYYWLSTRGRRLLGFVFIYIYYVFNEKGKETFSEEVRGGE